MADNYLEKQMEAYEARKAAWERQKKYKKKTMTQPTEVSEATAAEAVTGTADASEMTAVTSEVTAAAEAVTGTADASEMTAVTSEVTAAAEAVTGTADASEMTADASEMTAAAEACEPAGNPSCVDCGTQNCKFKDRTYPPFCPTVHLQEEDWQWAVERYDEGRNHDIMVASAEVEFEGYCQWTRVEEIMRFARKIGAHKIGIANCIGLQREARIFAQILRANGFEPFSVICKVGGKAKSSLGIPQSCETIGAAMCNPILQARLLNEAHTELNVVIGLCVGHDSLFYKYSEAYVTTLVTKDRVTGHNPAAALYTAQSYYKKKLF